MGNVEDKRGRLFLLAALAGLARLAGLLHRLRGLAGLHGLLHGALHRHFEWFVFVE